MSDELKDRITFFFPYLIAIAVPLAGLLIAVWRYSEDDQQQAMYLGATSLIAGFAWLVVLGVI